MGQGPIENVKGIFKYNMTASQHKGKYLMRYLFLDDKLKNGSFDEKHKTQICEFRARPFSAKLISCQNVQVMTGRSEHTAAWSYVIKNVRKIFRDKAQLQEDVKSWSLEI